MAQNKTTTENTKAENAATDTASTGGTTAAASSLAAAREKRQADMSVAGKADAKAEKAKAEKKPAFVVDEKARARLLKMSDAQLLKEAGEKLRPTDASNTDTYRTTGSSQDYLNGQDASRSGIRSAVLHFLDSREGKTAPVNVICAYMLLGAGVAYKGKFDYGYLTTKDGDNGKRGMVARKLIELVAKGEKPAEEEAKA